MACSGCVMGKKGTTIYFDNIILLCVNYFAFLPYFAKILPLIKTILKKLKSHHFISLNREVLLCLKITNLTSDKKLLPIS